MRAQRKIATIDSDPRAAVRGTISKLTYIEARRIKGPLYDALIAELYEEGCPYSAWKLRTLADKEIDMIEKGITRESVQHHKNLLLSLYDNAKMAEKAAQVPQCGGLSVTFQLMFQMLLMLDPYKEQFDWVLDDVYEIIAHICDRYEEKGKHGASELIARIYLKYGELLASKSEGIPKAIQNYERAIKLARGAGWCCSPYVFKTVESCETLHKLVALKLAELLLRYGQLIVRNDPLVAADMAHKAKTYIAEVGLDSNNLLYCRTCITHGNFLMEASMFKDALLVFEKIQKDIAKKLNYDYCKLRATLLLNMGICLTNLNELDKAKTILQQALYLNRIYGLKNHEGETQMNLGKLFSRKQELKMAKTAYEAAKAIFTELNDVEQNKTIVYLLAKLKADEIFPTFMDMVKSTSSHYCAFYNLRQWKNQCRPFWTLLFQELEKQEKDEMYCLLDKDTLQI